MCCVLNPVKILGQRNSDMQTQIALPNQILNSPLFRWAEYHHGQPWPIRHLATRHHLPVHVALIIADHAGIGGRGHER